MRHLEAIKGLQTPINLMCMFLVFARKLQYLGGKKTPQRPVSVENKDKFKLGPKHSGYQKTALSTALIYTSFIFDVANI